MSWFSEDPWIPVGALAALAAVFLLTMQVTQQGKYLIRAVVALGAAALILLVEWAWVTENEKIEAVVYDLADAVQDRDVDRALGHFAPTVRLVARGTTLGEAIEPARLRSAIEHTQFDMIRVRRLSTNAGAESKRGSAEFQIVASGTIETDGPSFNFAATDATWSLGFVQPEPGVWKVNRITPVRLPRGSESIVLRVLGRR